MEDKLTTFLDQYKLPIDIVFLLNGGAQHVPIFAPYKREDTFLFYRPKTSHAREVPEAFLVGEPHPDRTVLLVDSDMVEGNAMRETATYLEGRGYGRGAMFGYLARGFVESSDGPQLMAIDDLLEEGGKVRALVLEIGHM